MKTKKTRLGLAVLAGGLSFVGSASATDIVIDGSYESSTNNISGNKGTGGNDSAGIDGGWTAFTTYTYPNYVLTPLPGSGQAYLRPYENSIVSQIDDLTRALTTAQIDNGQGQFTASAAFSSYLAAGDYSILTYQFLDASQAALGIPVTLGGAALVATLPGGSGYRGWAGVTNSGAIPSLARYVSITSKAYRGGEQKWADGYVDLVSLDVTVGINPIQVASVSPANNATGVGANAVLSVSLQDGSVALNTGSVLMWFDGSPVTPGIQKPGATTSVQFDPPGLLASQSTHTYAIAYNNTGGATANTTNQYTFTVAPWQNINLGAPLYLETFDGVTEGDLPAGWSVANFTDPDFVAGSDLNNYHSDTFTNWTVISPSTLSNWATVDPPGAEYLGLFNVAPNQVINGAVVTNLIANNFFVAVSDGRVNTKQIQYLFTRDYDLSGQNNVYLAFDSAWVQNQDSMAAVEYSINGGATWLPAQYMLDGPDILDASNTFATVYGDVPTTSAVTGGNYGLFIGVAQSQWAGLEPYLSARVNDNQTTSMRVEVIRLAQADNQATVRFRFAHVGTASWYWGLDNFGLYSIPTVAAPLLVSSPTPAAQSYIVGYDTNPLSFTIAGAIGVGPITYQWRRNGTDLPGQTSQTLALPAPAPSDAGSYDVVAANPGGSVTSPPPVAVLSVSVAPPYLVRGQWNFDNGLAAFVGRDLEYYDAGISNDTAFGTTTALGIPDINGQPTTVMHFTPTPGKWWGYKMYHQTAGNAGGANVNQYTLVYDIYFTFTHWRSLLQPDLANAGDGTVFISPSGGVWAYGTADGDVTVGNWHRVALCFDRSGDYTLLTKFHDGVKVGSVQYLPYPRDGKHSLDTGAGYALLFADDSGDDAETYVSCVQFTNGRRPDAFIEALGGPSATKIPGGIKATVEGGSPVIRWTGGVPLQSADSLTGNWTTLGVSSPYTPPAGSTVKLYRPKIP